MKDNEAQLNNKENNDELENKEIDKLQYKQFVLIILLTVIMVLSSLTLSFSAVKMISTSKNMNYNSIIVPITPVPGDGGNENDQDIVFNYKEVDTIGNGIYITNMTPTLDEVGKAFVGDNYTFQFKLYFGNKSLDRYYEITAEKMEVSSLDSKYAKIYLESSGEALDSVFRENGKVKVFSEYENATINKTNDNEKVIYSGNITKKDIALGHKDFTLKMWLDEDAPMNNDTMNKTFVVKINVYAK